MTDLISRNALMEYCSNQKSKTIDNNDIARFPSADAEPKWSCTANFVAEQLDRLRKMTDEEKWEFFRKFFGMGDAVQGEWKHTITWQPYCSNCEYVFGEDEEFSPFWKYCPMCGARMKGGAE